MAVGLDFPLYYRYATEISCYINPWLMGLIASIVNLPGFLGCPRMTDITTVSHELHKSQNVTLTPYQSHLLQGIPPSDPVQGYVTTSSLGVAGRGHNNVINLVHLIPIQKQQIGIYGNRSC